MSDLTEALARHRRQIDQRDRQALQRLIAAYGQVYQRVQSELERVQAQIAAAEAAGETVGPSWLFREQRLQLLERLVEREVSTFARFAGGAIEHEQREFASLGQEHTRELILLGLDPVPPGATVAFSYLPREAIESLVGFLSDGSPLSSLLDELGPDASRSVRNALIQAVGTGIGPRQTARMIREALGGNLTRALTISRQETLRALRESSFRSAERNRDVLRGWVWSADLGPRACSVCISMHGSFHPADERLASHVQCRCTQVWITKTWEQLGFTGIEDTSVQPEDIESGAEWFARQSDGRQRQILGAAKHEAYKAGAIALDDLVGTTRSRQWGPGLRERSLQEIVGRDEALRLRREARA